MPSAANESLNFDHKQLQRSVGRSARALTLKKAQFLSAVLPRLDRALKLTYQRLEEMHKGVDVIVKVKGEDSVVNTVPYADIAKLNGSLVALVRAQGELVDEYPKQGKPVKAANANVIDAEPLNPAPAEPAPSPTVQ